jgi:hypothetical protein
VELDAFTSVAQVKGIIFRKQKELKLKALKI